MIKNYIKVAIRVLSKYRIYSIINVTGLALGMLCCLLIMLWVQDEVGFDGFHENEDRIYIILSKYEEGIGANSPWALTPTLKKDFPEIEMASRISVQNLLIKKDDQHFYEDIAFVDPDFLSMFTFPLIEGDASTALDTKQGIVLTEKVAQKYFPNENPIGKNLILNQSTNLTVTGVLRNPPHNSTHKFDMLVSIKNLDEKMLASWSIEAPGYVLLTKNADVDNLRIKMANTTIKYDKRIKNRKVSNDLQLFSTVHLYGIDGEGTILYVYLFSAIALIVLIIACINFINLFTAQSSVRSKEIGMRKVLGAGKRQVLLQFFGETILISFISFILALLLAMLILPGFNIMAEKHLSVDITNPVFLLGSFVIILFSALIVSSYPAIMFSSFQAINILKKSIFSGNNKNGMRWTLVVVQFTVSVILIVATITMNRQFNYIQNKKIGFNREQIISIQLNENIRNRFETVKNELLQYSNITHVTSSSSGPNAIWYSNPVYWEGGSPDDYESMNYVSVDESYLETFDIELAEGRNFRKALASDKLNYIVNETAIKHMKMDSPLGKMFSIWQREGKIIGVVKDFHSVSLHHEINPIVITQQTFVPNTQLYIRVKPEDLAASLKNIESTLTKFNPEYPFVYTFFDEEFNRDYQEEAKIKSLLQYFSLIVIFISCIGLFGLIAFMTQQLRKEIGIRKIAGAKNMEIVFLVFQSFAKWLLLAIVIAIPISYYFMHKWLENYAYKTDLSWWIFALAGALALGIALLTVSWQTWRAASKNPVESLRYE
jgi:ABC-type antimicrobial peptide transport system permease subunit